MGCGASSAVQAADIPTPLPSFEGKAAPSVGTGASPASTPPSSAESDGEEAVTVPLTEKGCFIQLTKPREWALVLRRRLVQRLPHTGIGRKQAPDSDPLPQHEAGLWRLRDVRHHL